MRLWLGTCDQRLEAAMDGWWLRTCDHCLAVAVAGLDASEDHLVLLVAAGVDRLKRKIVFFIQS